jgi:hypothetical protein
MNSVKAENEKRKSWGTEQERNFKTLTKWVEGLKIGGDASAANVQLKNVGAFVKTSEAADPDISAFKENPDDFGVPAEIAQGWNDDEIKVYLEEKMFANEHYPALATKRAKAKKVTAEGIDTTEIGDGGTPNKYWVSTTADFMVNTKEDTSSLNWAMDTKALDFKPSYKSELFGPFMSFKEAKAKYDELFSEIYPEPREDSFNTVTIEDRISGQVYEGGIIGYAGKFGYKFEYEQMNDTKFTSQKLGYDITTDEPETTASKTASINPQAKYAVMSTFNGTSDEMKTQFPDVNFDTEEFTTEDVGGTAQVERIVDGAVIADYLNKLKAKADKISHILVFDLSEPSGAPMSTAAKQMEFNGWNDIDQNLLG